MAQGKHVGKVVVAFPEAFVARRAEPLAPPFAVKQNGSYLITGAFGGFGKVHRAVAGRMRRPASRARRAEAAQPLRRREPLSKIFRARGVDVRVVKADVGSPSDVARLMRGDSRGRSAVKRSVSSGDGHRRCAAQRPHERPHAQL